MTSALTTSNTADIVFLIDVDNTLLDNEPSHQ